MPGRHKIWQVRQKGISFTVARHSKQIPIPHSGPRISPETDWRQTAPASEMATATIAPEGTRTAFPSTITSISSDIGRLRRDAGWQIWLDGYGSFCSDHLIYQNASSRQ